MPAAKKYKLHSASDDPNAKPVCAFFLSPDGCRNGSNCKFLHTTAETSGNKGKGGSGPGMVSENLDSSSVISSESEGEVAAPGPKKASTPPTTPKARSPATPLSGNAKGKDQNKKNNKKRKSTNSSSNDDPFANPKKTSGPVTSASKASSVSSGPSPASNSNKKQKLAQKNTPQKAASAKKTAPAAAKPAYQSLVSSLPIASFTIPGFEHSQSAKKDQQSDDSENTSELEAAVEESGDGRPLPTHTDVGRKWRKLVEQTRSHTKYNTAFDFDRFKELQKDCGITSEWIKAKPFGSWCESNPQAIAIDCEMCETQDPLTGSKDPKALCRISIINAENPEEVLLDTLVKPIWPVTDYRSRINGIKKEHLEKVEFTLRHAQAFMMALCSEETVIIGHAVQNDLSALQMEHHVNVDSSFLFHATDNPSATVSLKDLVHSIFKKDMPTTHDSVNDARMALDSCVHYLKKEGNVDAIERTFKQHSNQLFLHRLPHQCKASHIENMFLTHTCIKPNEIDEIEFSGETGKTHVTFRSPRHASLAFDTLESPVETDKSGKMQKKVYLRNGSYIRVRKMTHNRRDSGGKSPSAASP
jgi:RNA exonuclease 1